MTLILTLTLTLLLLTHELTLTPTLTLTLNPLGKAIPSALAAASNNPRDAPSGLEVAVRNIYGLSVPLGNTNFFQETYRACALSTHREVCG